MSENEEKSLTEEEKKSIVEEFIEKMVRRYMEKVEGDRESNKELEKRAEEYNCPECGAKVPELAKHCPGCGVELEWEK